MRSLLFVPIAVLAPTCCIACGGKTDATTSDSAAAETGEDSGDASQDASICNRAFPCEWGGLDDASDPCGALGAGWRDYACARVPPSAAGCTYLHPDCPNCADWCCPPGAEDAAVVDTGPSTADSGPPPSPPSGCSRNAIDDSSCVAQQKPGFAFHCSTPTSAAGCFGNPYPSGSCPNMEDPFSNLCCGSP